MQDNSVLIIVPTLGQRPELLALTLRSITEQRDVQADIVVVTPQSATEARRLASEAGAAVADDPGSLSGAVNVGLAMAGPHHRYGNWIGDDDLLAPRALAIATAALDADPSATVAFGHCDYIDADGRLLWTNKAGRLASWTLGWGPNLIPQPGSLFRIADFNAVGGLDTSLIYAMDLDLFLRLRARGRLINTGRVLSSFRWHATSTTVANRTPSLQESELIRRRYLSARLRPFAPLWEQPVRVAIRIVAGRVTSTATKLADRPAARPALPFVVVVPALNEQDGLARCLQSLVDQREPIRVVVSDNASDDRTAEIAASFSDKLDLTVRSVERRLEPSAHLIDAARFALSTTEGSTFAFLAGDDTWAPGFTAVTASELERNPEIDVVFPTFVWKGEGLPRSLPPASFLGRSPIRRRLKALLWPDHRELANLVYAAYRRDAFNELVTAWQRGQDEFAADYAAAWSVIGDHRVLACPDAVVNRHVRAGADLLDRVGMAGSQAGGILRTGPAYIRLNLRINKLTGLALSRVHNDGWVPAPWQLQLLRGPQWILGAVRQVRTR